MGSTPRKHVVPACRSGGATSEWWPYLNAKGEVVGLHSGSFKDPGNVAGDVFSAEGILKALTPQKFPKKNAAVQRESAEGSK